MSRLRRWYASHGRHDLPWRCTTDRWAVLVSEVMLHQTQVARVASVWPVFMARFPTSAAAAAAGPGDLIHAWGRLGYPRRARRLWEAARAVDAGGWPDDLTALPGVGAYTAAAITALVDDADTVATDVNVRRVLSRFGGARTGGRGLGAVQARAARGLHGRDRLLALMDLGALVCTPRDPRCDECPLRARCATRGVLAGEGRRRQGPYEGSFRQRRGAVLATLRERGGTDIGLLDRDALRSLVADGLAAVDGDRACLP